LTHGAIMLDGMHDDKVDKTATGNSADRYGFDDPAVQLPRTNRDRWWFRMSHHQKAPWDFNAKLDLDLVSDQDYLREFPSGYMGFEDTQKYFTKFFGRELDDYNDPIRLNRLNFNRIWPSWNINAELRYFWDSTQDNTDLPDTTISRLPVVDVHRPKRSIFKSPFYFDLDSNYNYFWRPSGSRGQRIDVHPRLYYPYQFENYFTFEPSAGVRETVYYLDGTDANDEFDKSDHRELFDLRLDFFSDVYRVFNVNAANIQKIRHSIRPQIVYDYIPEVSQSDLPEFDPADRIDKKSMLTYSLTNTFTSKLLSGGVTKLADRKTVSRGEVTQAPDQYNYKDFLRLELLQSYDFLKSNKAFSPIAAKLDLFPGQYISIDADTAWSVYGDGFVSHNIGTAIWDKRGDRLYVDYRYDKGILVDTDEDEPNVQSIYLDLNLKVNNKLSVFGDYQRNIEENLHIRTSLGFTYNTQCWAVKFRYVDEPNDKKYEFKINLHGLGGIGF
jgi:LPS-assembly protein